MHLHIVVAERADIGLDYMEVGERGHETVEINAIVPHEYIVGNLRPSLDSLQEITSGSIVGQRHLTEAVDVTQHDIDILAGFKVLRRMHGIEIGKR